MNVEINNNTVEIESENGDFPGYLYQNNQEVRQVRFLPQTQTIGSFAFEACANLSDLTLNDGLGHIRSCAFKGCRSLASVEFPSSLQYLDSGAFRDCANLTTVSFREGGTCQIVVGINAFVGCQQREAILSAIAHENSMRRENAERQALDMAMDVRVIRLDDIINFINRIDEQGRYALTTLAGLEITSRGAIGTPAPQFRRFFVRGLNNQHAIWTVHFEIETYDGGLNVEGHSERTNENTGGTPIEVHRYLRDQFRARRGFEFKGDRQYGEDRSFRFGARHIECVGRRLRDVLEEARTALRDLNNEYGGYLEYLDGWYYANGNGLAGVESYDDWMRGNP